MIITNISKINSHWGKNKDEDISPDVSWNNDNIYLKKFNMYRIIIEKESHIQPQSLENLRFKMLPQKQKN